ncbi:MAG: type VI secretion system baseplate subunit TssF [Gammaproteobacteria bacterium]|nr:type VI secretion system baseplate subunit TssF [Gammaproteobacteria bacterium]MBU1489649.1 type VI secretion system baseplate subunit TssF [Gammaproteobacteria bacterium]MBU2064903.1 type VI secretion system baseplate subunit TssF [Gammaproteobacteria bacterium]MBU2139257.1 type VI secretion system baseplate subunit TssF [Gammaproteobacteria bacterium]MBU2215195.1 type VI secretion system baseplate subunit TssF [Gammaproteobacteria bacterium]
MSFNHYYQSELTALRQLGKRFAERSPALAPFLGQAGRDPDVERLLEGFAFLTGRLRQKLDDELPELTHSLMHLLWPNYMRPLPAFSMLQFDPLKRPGGALLVPRHTPVESKPIQGVTCRFRTAFATEVLPLALSGLDYSVKGDGALLSLRMAMSADGHLGDLDLKQLRLHLSGERYISQLLYLSLLRHLGGIQLVLLDAAGKPLQGADDRPLAPLQLPASNVQPVGFAEDQALIPYPLNTFRGYRYLQEYFAFQDKFLFVDLLGLDIIKRLPEDVLKQARGIELRFDIHKAGVQRIRPTLDNVRLYCTPVVNLFAHDAIPIRLDGKQDQYLLLPAEIDSEHCGVFSVDRVTGWKPGGKGYEEYVPFESFEHDASFDVPLARPHYSVRQQPSLLGDGLETYLSFGLRNLDQHETLSIELTCTNQNLPRQLGLGDICVPCEDTPEFLTFRNISAVTPSYAPPLHRDFLWKLISNMSLNYLSLANVEALKVILETYDLPRYYDQHAEKVSKRLLAGLKSISHQHVDRLHRGLPVRGVRTQLTINPEGYLGEGDLFLFASVLNEFFALYASLNSYHELRVQSTQGEVYQWTPRMGLQPLL